jgi:hypothetical protein
LAAPDVQSKTANKGKMIQRSLYVLRRFIVFLSILLR